MRMLFLSGLTLSGLCALAFAGCSGGKASQTCQISSCIPHGHCGVGAQSGACVCDAGWTGAQCAQCGADYVSDASCGVGYCKSHNTPSSCVNGVEITCAPGSPLSSTDATCDGVDDNCNGAIDEGVALPAVPDCADAPPDPGPAQAWNHFVQSSIVVASGAAEHQGRDLFLNPGDPQWVLGKFAYGPTETVLVGEDVDLYLDRGCAGAWEKLGTSTTTAAGEHAAVEGVDDTGGRIFFAIPDSLLLGPGRHRIHMVVLGDLTTTEQIIEVVNSATRAFVVDLDGTITETEADDYPSMLTGSLPVAWPSSAAALNILAAKGLRPFYLTERPEWLDMRSREFLAANGYPPGILHTTLSFLGATGTNATTFKSDELAAVLDKAMILDWAFGNLATDADAYDNAGVQPVSHRIFIGLDDPRGGRRVDNWTELPGEFATLAPYCRYAR